MIVATIWHTLMVPWEQVIDRRALLEVLLLGITGGTLGCWIIFYNLSYSTESLAHALLPGPMRTVLRRAAYYGEDTLMQPEPDHAAKFAAWLLGIQGASMRGKTLDLRV